MDEGFGGMSFSGFSGIEENKKSGGGAVQIGAASFVLFIGWF